MSRRILHLAGSPTSEFFYDLSLVYARGCSAALSGERRYTFVNALVTPDGLWRFPRSLDTGSIDAAEPMDFPAAMARIVDERVDVALPQMFCLAGMTHYRAIFDLLRIPYLGNRPAQMALAADKVKTRSIVATAGVDVPSAEVLRRGELPTLEPPVVVKPAASDNSDGVSLVTSTEQFASALEDAFVYSDAVLVERYVELGREVRCGIIARDGELLALPLEEYRVDPIGRIRKRTDKLRRDAENGLTLAAKEAAVSWIVAADDPIVASVWRMARRCHEALGCEQYSLFDFRIDPTGRPWFLEAGLYCSFSPQSVVVTMAKAAGLPLDALFDSAIEQLTLPNRRGRLVAAQLWEGAHAGQVHGFSVEGARDDAIIKVER
jgi:D-alanine-D-alanine ligase